MDYFTARAGVDGSRLSGPSSGLGQFANRTDLLEYADNLRQEIESRGFTVRYSAGPVYTVVGLPAVGGTNEQLVVANAANAAQRDAWNAELAPIWEQYAAMRGGLATVTPIENPWGSAGKPVPEGFTVNYADLFERYQQAVNAQNWTLADDLAREINTVTAAGPIAGGVPIEGLPPGQVMSPDELEAKRIRESGLCIPQASWDALSPGVRQYLSPSQICQVSAPPPPPDDIVPPAGGDGDGFGGKLKPDDGLPVTTMVPGPDGETTTVPKVPKPSSVFAPFAPPQEEEETGGIPVTQAGIGGGMFGLLALGGLALAVLMAPKRKR